MAKRPKDRKIAVKHKTWFKWCECLQCENEFRRENGFKAYSGPYYGGRGQEKYLCASCGQDIEHANWLFLQIWDNIKNWRPEPSPVPPKKLIHL